jgi:hypothetical protein
MVNKCCWWCCCCCCRLAKTSSIETGLVNAFELTGQIEGYCDMLGTTCEVDREHYLVSCMTEHCPVSVISVEEATERFNQLKPRLRMTKTRPENAFILWHSLDYKIVTGVITESSRYK